MHRLRRCSTTPSALRRSAPAGHADTHAGSLQWKHAVDMESTSLVGNSPEVCDLTRRSRRPGGVSFSIWQATSQEWQQIHFLELKTINGSIRSHFSQSAAKAVELRPNQIPLGRYNHINSLPRIPLKGSAGFRVGWSPDNARHNQLA